MNNYHGPDSIEFKNFSSRLTITVIIRSFNRVEFLPNALNSLLAQTLLPDSIIVVDDGSTDGTLKFLGRLNIPRLKIMVHETNLGAAAAYNTALSQVKTDLLAFLDSDDAYEPNFIARMLKEFHDNPDISFSYCRIVGGPRWTLEGCDKFKEALQQFYVSAMGTLVVRRDAANRVGQLPTRAEIGLVSDMCEDDRLSFELARIFCFSHVPEPLYRVMPNLSYQSTKNRVLLAQGWGALLVDYFEELVEIAGTSFAARHLSNVLFMYFRIKDIRLTFKFIKSLIRKNLPMRRLIYILYLTSKHVMTRIIFAILRRVKLRAQISPSK